MIAARTAIEVSAEPTRIAATWPGELSRPDLDVAFIHVQSARKDQGAIAQGQEDADVAQARTEARHDPCQVRDQTSQHRVLRMPKHVSDRMHRVKAANRASRVGLDRARHDEDESHVRYQREPKHDGEPRKDEDSK